MICIVLIKSAGLIALFSMLLMYTTAVEGMRRPYFEAFWYTHHLFIIFYAALICHGLGHVLEKATFWYWVIGPLTGAYSPSLQ